MASIAAEARFLQFLIILLEEQQIDAEVYAEYFLTLLKDDGCDVGTLTEWIHGICPDLSEDGCVALSAKIFSAYLAREQQPTDLTEQISDGGTGNNNLISEPAAPAPHDKAVDSETKDNSEVIPSVEVAAGTFPSVNDIAAAADEGVSFQEWDDSEDTDDVPLICLAEVAFAVEELLAERYPTIMFSSELIVNLLNILGYHRDAVVNIVSRAYDTASSCKPCRHMLNSSCRLVNCPFEHDVSMVPCRYWLLFTGCAALSSNDASRSCVFLHDIPGDWLEEEMLKNGFNAQNNSDISSDSQLYFPSLPAKISANQTRPDEFFVKAEANNKVSRSKKQKQIIRLGAASYEPKREGGSHSSAQPAQPAFIVKEQTNMINIEVAARWFCCADQTRLHGQLALDGIAWVDTGKYSVILNELNLTLKSVAGKSVGTEYINMRQKAREAALARNKLLDNASRAYISYVYFSSYHKHIF
jgi:hypothetical protein